LFKLEYKVPPVNSEVLVDLKNIESPGVYRQTMSAMTSHVLFAENSVTMFQNNLKYLYVNYYKL